MVQWYNVGNKGVRAGLVCRTPHLPGICCTILCKAVRATFYLSLLLLQKQALTSTQVHARMEENVTLTTFFLPLIWNSLSEMANSKATTETYLWHTGTNIIVSK